MTQFRTLTLFDCPHLHMDHICYDSVEDFSYHHHDICELLFLLKGDAFYSNEGRVYTLKKNSLVFTRPFVNHVVTFRQHEEYERYYLLFDEKKLSSGIQERIPAGLEVVDCEGNRLICDLFKKTDYYCSHFNGDTLANILFHLTEEVLYNLCILAGDGEQNDMYTVNPLINEAVKYINENISSPLNIEALCNRLYISKSHMHNLFIKHLQMSPKKYIISKRLIMAQRELRLGANPSEIYQRCGFSDYSTFYREYKQYFGYPPSAEASKEMSREINS